MVRTFLLCSTLNEARDYARAADLTPRDSFLVSPRSLQALDGVRVTEDDLIIEFPGFRDHPDAWRIIEMIKRSAAKSPGAGPDWRAVGKP